MLNISRWNSLFIMIGVSLFGDSGASEEFKGPVLSSALPDTCYGVTFEAGLIYEQMRVTNAGICTEISTGLGSILHPPIGPVGTPTTTDLFVNYTFDLEPGIRVLAGYDVARTGWTLCGAFEWLPSTASFVGPVKNGVLYRPTDQQVVFVDYDNTLPVNFQEANASLGINYYLLDVTLSRGSFFSGNFTYEPFAGVQASWIFYRMNKQFLNDQNDTDPMSVTTSWARKARVDFWGVGPEVGLDFNYIIGPGVSIFSSSNFAVLFGNSYLTDYSGFITVSATPGYSKVENSLITMTTTLRNVLGLQFDKEFDSGTQRGVIRLGMDGRLYYNQFPVVERLGGLIAVDGKPGLITNPYIRTDNSFGMIGLLLELGWDF